MSLRISDVQLVPASDELQRTGLLGWICCVAGGVLRFDGITLRRTRDDRLALSYPARRDATGAQHPYILPIDEGTRSSIEAQILAALEREGWLE